MPYESAALPAVQLRLDEAIELSQSALVIIDTPPLLPVTDAAIIATRANGALIVTSAGHTTYDMLQKALENLERANARALGVVLNKVPRRGGSYYGYQYQSYQRKEENKPRRVKPSGTTTEAAPGPRRSSTEPGGPATEAEALPTGQRPARRSARTDS
ncbi:MAG: hypothetical protein Q7U41_03320 [Microbacterium sp.]|nr:hypothetical protein [Microbacterium sp.]